MAKKKTEEKLKNKNQNKKKVLLTKKSLHGAIKGLLNDIKRDTTVRKSTSHDLLNPTSFKNKKRSHVTSNNSTTTTSTTISNGDKIIKRKTKINDSQLEYLEKNGIIYIKSKENRFIPKLTDDELMVRHKKADETMRDVWNKIIEKYENVVDQGDVLNLQTGEIIEDHGHLKGDNTRLPLVDRITTSYKTSIMDILYKEEEEKEEKERKQIRKKDKLIPNNKESLVAGLSDKKTKCQQASAKSLWDPSDNDNDNYEDVANSDDIEINIKENSDEENVWL
ncbi:Scm3p PWA37_001685 [Arxiozyma heterogenica]|uniref:Scm3p n=1 Tax=Arxiozyma heterogenica TaxID=278026 RepID=UPI002EED7A26